MCLAIPGQIVEISEATAKVNIMGMKSEVNIQIIEEAQIGDYVLIHAGCAIQKIDIEYFEELNDLLKLLSKVEVNNEQEIFN
ncbi:hydrogenase assembly chaperone HypC/HupF [Clostridium sartagoforme AAU1]|jgi:hydrogenase expression/formation protein HypC|uniref:Hydrogenase assembly chaperone HypC/HupF n=1 Tax=Clostridium sartagoforme AAU1 TaxID=1202534 RepID=R9CHJ7_9CLOT|nr:HypC/HybG/HupF family hydrogenase formation chaperone [Clostridium sartagoforme]EOR26676.1 hydrogenase assembly chaperone HypC/HupF [Clostridium sartagoforme AAU1]